MTTSPGIRRRASQSHLGSVGASSLAPHLETGVCVPAFTVGARVHAGARAWPTIETSSECLLCSKFDVLGDLRELWGRRSLATASAASSNEASIGLSSRGIEIHASPDAEEDSESLYNYSGWAGAYVSAGENRRALGGFGWMPETETVSPRLGPTSSAFDSPLPHGTEVLFREIETFWVRSWSDPSILRSATVMDRVEVEGRLKALESIGQSHFSQRIRMLQEPDEEDIPLSDQAVLGFLDFMDTVSVEEVDLGLTSAQGWLCAQWTYPDGRVLVVWHKTQADTALTAFDSGRQILGHIGRDPRASKREAASQLLVQEKFFSWR